MNKEYVGKEKGHEIEVHLKEDKVSLNVQEPNIGIPTTTWEKDGWKLTPVTHVTVSTVLSV